MVGKLRQQWKKLVLERCHLLSADWDESNGNVKHKVESRSHLQLCRPLSPEQEGAEAQRQKQQHTWIGNKPNKLGNGKEQTL